jgi:8-oxo-dGTP pyrophosphatase MutT (NUDIX family)
MTSQVLEPMLKEAGCTLSGDRFGGITITLQPAKNVHAKNVDWNDAFKASLKAWKGEGKVRGVWLHVNPTTNVHAGIVMQAAVNNDFQLHTIDGNKVVLKQWLPDDAENVLPDAPHHQLGIAGMVVNGRGEVLVIQERRGPTAALKGFWKLPGGLVDPCEDMSVAVAREVMEETGVSAKFHSIVTFRETHSGPFGSTDLYCVCAMTLVNDLYTTEPSPQPVSPHPDEIRKVAWVPMKEFTGSKYYKKGLYGALLKTAAPAAVAAAKEAANKQTIATSKEPGMREIRMKGIGGKIESMFYAGQAKL